MAPNTTSASTGRMEPPDEKIQPIEVKAHEAEPKEYKREIVWRNVILFTYLHLAALYGIYLMFTSAKILTTLWVVLLSHASGLGIGAGVHRLWSHRAYKAKWPLRLMLMIFNTLAFQNHIYEWSRDHRVHHKYSDTNADPHNASRGFFFSHVGWLLVKKHPDVKEKGKTVDMKDLEQDPIVAFQKKYYLLLVLPISFAFPTMIPMYLWNESFSNAWFAAAMFRYAFTLNMTWLVNSAAHFWGAKPYDKNINPAQNLGVSLMTLGEGWHNYHHIFPWDYKAAELGNYSVNLSTAFLDFMARIGWAYDLKTVPMSLVQSRVKRTGDGSHEVWGWGDKDMLQEDIDGAQVINSKSK